MKKTGFQNVYTPFWDLVRGGTDRPRTLQERGGTDISRDCVGAHSAFCRVLVRDRHFASARAEQSDRHNSVTM